MRLQSRDPFKVRGTGGAADNGSANPTMLSLPPRQGKRPRVSRHPVPHRVLDRPPPEALRQAVQQILDDLAIQHAPATEFRTSLWEKNNRALFLRRESCSAQSDGHNGPAREVGHIHPSDASMHVTLAPGDAQKVIDLGWGQLHALAGGKQGLPATYTLLYPPRCDADLAPIRAILTAAVHHASEVLRIGESTRP
ncbi:hypothetical protein ABZ733_37785 [Streptomyces longwoodensis]|uniref:luciferase domain-containing protein n=1 Tax=Streptomyces longwoodensis TaxID=68231 RepID=UPI0033F538BD